MDSAPVWEAERISALLSDCVANDYELDEAFEFEMDPEWWAAHRPVIARRLGDKFQLLGSNEFLHAAKEDKIERLERLHVCEADNETWMHMSRYAEPLPDVHQAYHLYVKSLELGVELTWGTRKYQHEGPEIVIEQLDVLLLLHKFRTDWACLLHTNLEIAMISKNWINAYNELLSIYRHALRSRGIEPAADEQVTRLMIRSEI